MYFPKANANGLSKHSFPAFKLIVVKLIYDKIFNCTALVYFNDLTWTSFVTYSQTFVHSLQYTRISLSSRIISGWSLSYSGTQLSRKPSKSGCALSPEHVITFHLSLPYLILSLYQLPHPPQPSLLTHHCQTEILFTLPEP